MRLTDSLLVVLPLFGACGSVENEPPPPNPTIEEEPMGDTPERPTPPPPAPATETESERIELTPEDREIVENYCERVAAAAGESPPYDLQICTSGLELELHEANTSQPVEEQSPASTLATCIDNRTDLESLRACREAITRP